MSIKDRIKNAKPLIKPCPFCYQKAELIKNHRSYVDGMGDDVEWAVYAFQCKNCKSQSAFKEKEEDARRAWNRRGKLDPKAELVSRSKPIKGTKGCILSTGGSEPHLRIYRKHNPDGRVTPGSDFDDYYLDLDFIFDLWLAIDDDPMEYKEYLQPDGTKIKILGYTEFAWKGGKKYPALKPGETQILEKEE